MSRNRFIWCFALSIIASFLYSCNNSPDMEIHITPRPVSIAKHNGNFVFSSSTKIVVENEEQAVAARYFANFFSTAAGFTPAVVVGNNNGNIYFTTDSTLCSEAYSLNVSSKKIEIKAADIKGFFYALQTLRLSLPASIDARQVSTTTWSIPAMTINDQPRFIYRGLMLDVARYFMPKEDLLNLIDCMAMLKLNYLHLHLTDDNGWRLEIKKYPKLTDIGAWRVDRGNLPFPDRRNPEKGEPTPIGGFYTQDDMREIISYAAERQIDLIPEIDIPAHSNAALAAYPEYACPVVKKYIGVLPGLGGSNADIIYCAGNEKVFSFLQDVFDEVMEIFPSKYVHIGGDEAWKTHWKKCPLCQARIRNEKLADEEALQGYFMNRISKYLQSKGKEVMGWDELTNSVVPDDVIVFGWQGFGNAALKAAEKGHRFVMTPAKVLYLIRYQGPQWFEPLTYFGNNTLKDVYDYEPVQENWKPEYESLLMGVQGSMWTEFCNRPEDVTYQIFPRLAALAEIAWSPKGSKNWNEFLKALDNYNAHLDAKGIKYAKSMYNIQHVAIPENGNIRIALECIRPDMEIRYSTDGTEPNANSELYADTLSFSKSVTLKAATFATGKQMGQTLILPVKWNKATGKQIVDAKGNEKLLTNGIRGSLRQSDFEWCTWNKMDKNSFTIDLGNIESIDNVTIGCLTNYGMGVHKPQTLSVEISDNGKDFNLAEEKKFSHKEIFKEGNFIEDISFPVKGIKGRYVRITATGAGNNPENHLRPGQLSRYYFDEVIVE